MAKNIVLFVDGTGNDGPRDKAKNEQTNVFRLYELCTDKHKLYLPGVGSKSGDLLGGAAGFGTRKRLRLAYNFLVSDYQLGDSIYLFGFSRGALAVRLLADFLWYAGSLFFKHPFDKYLPYVYRIYEGSVILDVVGAFESYIKEFDPEIPPVPVHFLGVWDTVERYYPRDTLPHIEKLAGHIDHARQALAIHERRKEMEPRLWTNWHARGTGDKALPTVKQAWFPGAHSDVGGGYAKSRLSEASLAWMISEAQGLQLNVVSPTATSQPYILHQQRTGSLLTGTAAAIRYGENTRVALSTADAQVISTMDFNAIAENHLNNTAPLPSPMLRNHPPFKMKGVVKNLATVDAIALPLLKQIRKTKPLTIP